MLLRPRGYQTLELNGEIGSKVDGLGQNRRIVAERGNRKSAENAVIALVCVERVPAREPLPRVGPSPVRNPVRLGSIVKYRRPWLRRLALRRDELREHLRYQRRWAASRFPQRITPHLPPPTWLLVVPLNQYPLLLARALGFRPLAESGTDPGLNRGRH